MSTEAGEGRADRVAARFRSAFIAFGTTLRDGWFRQEIGFIAGVSGVHAAEMNGVWAVGRDADPNDVGRALDDVAASGLPHCAQVRPSASALHEILQRRGMTFTGETPLMELADFDGLDWRWSSDAPRWQIMRPADSRRYLEIVARGFAVPTELFAPFITPELMELPGIVCVVGFVGDEPVTTGLSLAIGDACGIYNVATAAEYRGRGYGAAVTRRCLEAGHTAGACWAFLQSSSAGLRVYEALGFETVERWGVWATSE